MSELTKKDLSGQKIVQGKTGRQFLAGLEGRPETRTVAEAFRLVLKVTKDIEQHGGAARLVGGSVRDELLNLPVKDFDLEIYHLPLAEIKKVAARHGRVEEVGRAFGVLKLWSGQQSIDLAAPRRESKTGRGHKGFDVTPDPTMTVTVAARRRDFTINALAKHPVSGQIIDVVGGLDDLCTKTLRVVDSKTFIDDPLRVLRAVQFVARFGLQVEPATLRLLKKMRPSLGELPSERLVAEWEKLWLKAPQPSIGLALARDIGLFADYPEIQKMPDTPQDKEFHPEGDVWTHTMMVVDQAAALSSRADLADKERLPVMLAAFGHDVGKTTTTQRVGEHIRSYGHEIAGLAPMERWLSDQGFAAETIRMVLPIIREHMNPTGLYHANVKQPLNDGPFRRLANRLHPATIKELIIVCRADHFGRDLSTDDFPAGEWLLERAARLHIDQQKPEPIIRGRDLLALGYPAGPSLGKIIRAAEMLAEEKSMTGSEIISRLKNCKTSETGLAVLESLLKK